MRGIIGTPAAMCLAACLLAMAAEGRAQDGPPPFDEKKAAALIENQFVVAAGYLFIADAPTFSKSQEGSLEMALTGRLAFAIEHLPAPSDIPEFRFLLRGDVVNYDLCNVYPVQKIPTGNLRILVNDRFYEWEDVVRPRIRTDGRQKYRGRPLMMNPADLVRARKCLRGPGGGYRGQPVKSLHVQLGDDSPMYILGLDRGSRDLRRASCSVPPKVINVHISPAPDVSDSFGVHARALSALRCTWPDGRTKLMSQAFVRGESAPVPLRSLGKNANDRYEFMLDDLAPLWKEPPFPKYTQNDVEAALDEPLNGGMCAAEYLGHRLTILYEDKVMLDSELQLEKGCVPKT